MHIDGYLSSSEAAFIVLPYSFVSNAAHILGN